MDPMRKVGFIMAVPGAIMLIIMIFPIFLDSMIPREGSAWTLTWASVLGLFFFIAGFALIWVTGGIKGTRDKNR